jgi:hypothetical protein
MDPDWLDRLLVSRAELATPTLSSNTKLESV